MADEKRGNLGRLVPVPTTQLVPNAAAAMARRSLTELAFPASKQDPDAYDPDYFKPWGGIYERERRMMETQALFDILKASPKDVLTLVKLANTYREFGFWSEAILYGRLALDICPDDIDVRTDLGEAYFRAGFPDEAIEQFNRVLKVSPHSHTGLFYLGMLLLEVYADRAGAIAAWEKLLNNRDLQPEQVQGLQTLIAKARDPRAGVLSRFDDADSLIR